ncbi:hypothetical protein [Arthrobacter sp. Br18]|uniref:hypothetical protein n=1 Tax=Arthrobacter sp. Br18 TaxID=1312954 RepID=UPI00047992D5|nr:hypothetical protein [Arthrobacter sp. Br18]
MECLTWFAPILPGKLDAFNEVGVELRSSRREEYQRSRRRMGIVREVTSYMATPAGEFACIFQEGEDIGKALSMAATSEDPFDEWFRGRIAEIHGILPEMLQGPPPAKLHADFRIDA